VLALSKADLVAPEVASQAASDWRGRVDFPVFVTSSATGAGLVELRNELLARVPVAEPAPAGAGEDDVAEFAVLRPGASRAFDIARADSGEWVVSGEAVERLVARHDMENEEAQALVERRLHRMGVIAALERAGFEPGDEVEIAGTVFELDPGAPF
jgi:GTP-binding protein